MSKFIYSGRDIDWNDPTTYPEIVGFKTPVKHMFDPPEHWARVEEWFTGRTERYPTKWRRIEIVNE